MHAMFLQRHPVQISLVSRTTPDWYRAPSITADRHFPKK
jgi:hypothetical protein